MSKIKKLERSELLEPIKFNWQNCGLGAWLDRNYAFRIYLEKGRYKPSLKGTYLIVGGTHSFEAAELICRIILNDKLLNQPLQKAA